MKEFEELIGLASQNLYAYLLSRTRDHYLAEDLLQETLLKAYLALETSEVVELEAWLMTIAKFTMFDYYKKQRRIQVQAADFFERQATGAKADPLAQVLTELEAEAALKLLRRLPAAQQKALALVLIKGFSYEEASQMLDLPINTLKSQVKRGREKLRYWNEEGNSDGRANI